MSEKLVLCKNGRLVEHYWDGKKRQYLTRLVKLPTTKHLHEMNFELEPGTTLRNIFEYMNQDLPYWDLLIGNWCKDIVTEGLQPDTKGDGDDWCKTLYLELYRHIEIQVMDGKHELTGDGDRLEFHGVGEYIKDSSDGFGKKGDRVNLGIEFTPANELAKYEVRIEPTFEMWRWDYDTDVKIDRSVNPPKDINPGKYYPDVLQNNATLFGALYGIIWELSFCGPPAKRNNARQSLLNSAAQLKAGKLKTKPLNWKKLFGTKGKKNGK